MAKQVQQFRYYGENHKNNSQGISMGSLVNGSIFGKYHNITQLGIQALPGTRFFLNNPSSKNNAIIVGSTGIYELDLQGLAEIISIKFDRQSIQAINDNYNAYLIVDIIYEGEE